MPNSQFLRGRETEMEQLRRAVLPLQSVSANGPERPEPVRLVEISGPPGIGKSALLNVLADEAANQRMIVVRASAARAEQDRAFSLLIALLDELLIDLPVRTTSDAPEGDHLDRFEMQDLAAVLPGLRLRVAADRRHTRPDNLLVARATRHALAALAAEHAGVALLIDDMQWSDEATSAVLNYLIRRGLRVPLLVGFAVRSGTATSPDVGGTLRETIELGPLDRLSAVEILTDISVQQRNEILEISGGNPFYLTELAKAARNPLPSHSSPGQDSQSRWPAPVIDSILGQLAAVSPQARLLARTGAVVADHFDLYLCAALAGMSDEDAGRSVDELCAVGLVEPVADHHVTFTFRHPIVATVVYQAAGPGWRMDCHRRAAALLKERGASAVQIAPHLERGAVPGDAEAMQTLGDAAAEARPYTPGSAARWYGAALRLCPSSGPEAAARSFLAVAQADCLIAAGHADTARELMIERMERSAQETVIARAALIATVVRAETWLGRDDQARTRIEPILDQLPSAPSVERMALECLAMLHVVRRADVEQARQWGANAASIADSHGTVAMQFSVTAARAFSEARLGDGVLTAAMAEQAQAKFDVLPDDERRRWADAVGLLGSVQQWLGRPRLALRLADAGLLAAEASGNAAAQSMLRAVSEGAWSALGRFDRAEDVNLDAEDTARMTGDPEMVAVAMARRALLCAVAGDISAARRAAESAEDILPKTRRAAARATVAASVAPVWLSLGNPCRARLLLLDHCGGPGLDQVVSVTLGLVLELLTQSELAAQDVARARHWAEWALQQSGEGQPPLLTCWAKRAMATVLLAEGDSQAALSAADEAVIAVADRELPVELAKAEVTAARAELALGLTVEGVERLTRALAFYDRSGAVGLASEVRRYLRVTGIRLPHRNDSGALGGGPAALSKREIEVANLVERGRGNREIAAQLFISTRTVESHLRRIFLRLGVRSRAEVATAVRDWSSQTAGDSDFRQSGSDDRRRMFPRQSSGENTF